MYTSPLSSMVNRRYLSVSTAPTSLYTITGFIILDPLPGFLCGLIGFRPVQSVHETLQSFCIVAHVYGSPLYATKPLISFAVIALLYLSRYKILASKSSSASSAPANIRSTHRARVRFLPPAFCHDSRFLLILTSLHACLRHGATKCMCPLSFAFSSNSSCSLI